MSLFFLNDGMLADLILHSSLVGSLGCCGPMNAAVLSCLEDTVLHSRNKFWKHGNLRDNGSIFLTNNFIIILKK